MSFMSTWGHGMNCFLCGMMIQAGDRRFKGLAIPERKGWAEKELKGDQLVLAPEVEETSFGKLSTQWGHFFRAIVEGPPDSTLVLTGIGFRENDSKAVVPASPGKACIVAPSCASHGKRQCKVFRARGRRIFPLDDNYSNLRFGYPVHAHCWMLVDHVIGLGIVEKNLRAFCETLYEYWSKHAQHW
ncbi:hypothetical protein ASPCAL10048 [Aspergillus calidoustus]|uniref:Uncharacterized protein n=1 Tax=Aspergillus calidoustus TaxID=454130 RepID=A0A0U5G8D1_ASPCI|nr:hypothetical protein ASPCAL10048 [Aspergillus calidoustus]